MFMPQWQTKTPIRGSSSDTSFSGGYSFTVVSVSLSEEIRLDALTAAPLACATLSGMSFGEENAPQTYTPGLEVSSGENVWVEQKSYVFNSKFSALANSSACLGGFIPTERTTRFTSSLLGFSSST